MAPPACSNRPEGFGPRSAIHPSLPTTCFTDTVLIPLSTYLLLASIAAHFLVKLVHPFSAPVSRPRPKFRNRSLVRRVCTLLYWTLLVCEIAMFCLEIARMVEADLGVGLLPIMLVGILIVGPLKALWRKERYWLIWLAVAFWGLLVVFGAIGTVVLADELGVAAPPRTKYPVADELTDRSVYVGVALFLLTLELVDILETRQASSVSSL